MAELTPLTEAELDTYDGLIGEHGALAATPARRLIAELRALREAARHLAKVTRALDAEFGQYLNDQEEIPIYLKVGDLRRLRDLLPAKQPA